MINMNQFATNSVADNTVTLNGATFKVTDEVFLKILDLCRGNIGTVSQPDSKVPVSTTKSPKTPYVATKDFKPQYEIKEQTSTSGTKLFCISRKNGWTKAEKKCMNDAIKALKGIKEIEVSYEKDGKTRTFKAWGYNTESTAKKHFKELPSVFTAEQLNSALWRGCCIKESEVHKNNYYYELKNNGEWWWEPLPQYVTNTLSDDEIKNIINLSDDELVKFHNKNPGFGDVRHNALMWVAQGECWRRGFKAVSISARRV